MEGLYLQLQRKLIDESKNDKGSTKISEEFCKAKWMVGYS
jgi:hypothetical protein